MFAANACWRVHRHARRIRNAAVDETHQIFFCNASRNSTSLQSLQIESVLGGHLSNERRRLGANALFEGRSVLRRGCCNLGCRLRDLRFCSRYRRNRFSDFFGGLRRSCGERALLRLHSRNDGLHLDRLAFLYQDFGDDPRARRRNFRVDLVSRDLEDRLVALHLVAHFLQPLRKRALGDRLAHLRHDDVYKCHPNPLIWNYLLPLRSFSNAEASTPAGLSPQSTYRRQHTRANRMPGFPQAARTRARSRQSSPRAPRSFRH